MPVTITSEKYSELRARIEQILSRLSTSPTQKVSDILSYFEEAKIIKLEKPKDPDKEALKEQNKKDKQKNPNRGKYQYDKNEYIFTLECGCFFQLYDNGDDDRGVDNNDICDAHTKLLKESLG